MELNATTRLKRNGAISRTTPGGAAFSAKPQTFLGQNRADRLSLSRQALAFLEEQNRKAMEQAERESSGSDRGEAALDFLEKSTRELDNCHKISVRIMKGDHVPPEDLAYLMKHDINGYRMAMALRRPKEDPKEWESVLTDKEKEEAVSLEPSGSSLSSSSSRPL